MVKENKIIELVFKCDVCGVESNKVETPLTFISVLGFDVCGDCGQYLVEQIVTNHNLGGKDIEEAILDCVNRIHR